MSDQTYHLLSFEQKWAVLSALEGKNLFITGGGGTGKTFCIKHIVHALRHCKKTVALTSTTGISAINIGGRTIHSYSGLGIGNQNEEGLRRLATKGRIKSIWNELDVLIIDEISMLQPDYMKKLDFLARKARNVECHPFGGIQLIFVGDFFQLPPVHKSEDEKEFSRNKYKPKFCFETKLWKRCCLTNIVLKTTFRQGTDKRFIQLLNNIRLGQCKAEDIKLLESRLRVKLNTPPDIKPTILYSTNKNVDFENKRQMSLLKTKEHVYHSFIITPKRIINGEYTQLASQDIPKNVIDKHVKQLKANCPSKNELVLKNGAQVMLTSNVSVEMGLANGARGVIVGFTDDSLHYPIVKFTNNLVVKIPFFSWNIDITKKNYMGIAQIPLRIAYAYTIHKSQSQSLEYVSVALNKRVFAPGQAYVALSRVTSLNGLSLISFDASCIKADVRVVEFEKYLKSTQLYNTPAEVNRLHEELQEYVSDWDFTKDSGGRRGGGDDDEEEEEDEEDDDSAAFATKRRRID